MRLHLGAGKNPMDGWVNLDQRALPGIDVVFDLDKCATERLPFDDNTVEVIFGNHVIEHIHNTLPLMQELHRVAVPDAECLFKLPFGASDDAWENPTHVRPYFLASFNYFSQPFFFREDYGYTGDWNPEKIGLVVHEAFAKNRTPEEMLQVVCTERNVVQEMHAWLKAVKPIREAKRELQTRPEFEFLLI